MSRLYRLSYTYGLYIDWTKNKNATINPVNKKDNKS